MIRSRLGGRWAVSWQGYLLLFPVSVPLALLVVPAFATVRTWLTGFLVATLAYAVTGVVLWLASISVLRNRRVVPSPVWLVVIVGGLSWAVRSAVFAVSLTKLDMPVETGVAQRLAVGFLVGALLVPGIAWLLATIDDFRLERQRLLDELVRQELLAEGSTAYVAVLRDDILARVDEQVRSIARSATLGSGTVDDAPDLVTPEQLDSLERAVRATSHELAQTTMVKARQRSRISLAQVLQAAARRPFTLWPLPPYLLIGVLFVSRFVPLAPTMAVFAVSGVWAVLVTWLANAWCARSSGPAVGKYLVMVLLMSVSGFIAGFTLHVLGDQHIDARLMITVSISLLIVMVAGGIAHAVNVAEEDVLTDVRESISAVEVRSEAMQQEESRLRREIAIHLHGTVAANVTAAAMRLRQAINDGNVVVAKAAYVEVRQLLDTDLRASLLVQRADVGTLLTELAESWSGIADVRVDVSGLDEPVPAVVRDVVDVVTEAVSNAVRHGDARTIDVSVAREANVVRIVVNDDGRGRSRGERGLGTSMFDHIAPGNWSLTDAENGGTSFTLALTV